jgi:hypothetical protein
VLKLLSALPLALALLVGCGAPLEDLPEDSIESSDLRERCYEVSEPGSDLFLGCGPVRNPTPTPTATPIKSVRDVNFCVHFGTCTPPAGFTDQGGYVYLDDNFDHRLFQLYGDLSANTSYIADMKTNFRLEFETPPTFAGYSLLTSYCEPGFFFEDCMDLYVKRVTYTSGTPAARVVNTKLCIKANSEAWETPDCALPAPAVGGTVKRISPTGGYGQCIGDDESGNPHCYNVFIETLP